MNQDNYPCICGHYKKLHKEKGPRYTGVCYHSTNGYYDDHCEKYRPDNLKYLEQKSNDRI